MPITKLWQLAYRDIARNPRRSLLTLLAVALGLALLIVMNGLIAGVFEDSLQNSIRLRTGHLQIRAASYQEADLSLQAHDLLSNPDALAARARALPEVQSAAPVLWASALLATADESAGVQIFGIDTTAALYDPIRAALVAGTFLEPDDRSGILIGQRLAESLGLQIGRKINLTIVTADGQADQGSFTIRGLFATGIPSYDESAALLPLAKAQAFTHANGRASAVVVLLKQQANTAEVAAALHEPGTNTLTWQMLNQAFIASIQLGESFYVLLDLIVILIVAVIIANTLLMSVFERIREIGILSALGMKGRQIIQMLLLEAAGLGVAGIILGLGIGLAGVTYLAMVGIPLASSAASVGTNVALSSVMHARFAFDIFAQLAAATLLITLVAALYPAWYAARLEPVVALHS